MSDVGFDAAARVAWQRKLGFSPTYPFDATYPSDGLPLGAEHAFEDHAFEARHATDVEEAEAYCCRICDRPVEAGQSVLYCLLPSTEARYGSAREFFQHVPCVTRLLACAPPDATTEAFHRLRDRIIETGEAFPDDH